MLCGRPWVSVQFGASFTPQGVLDDGHDTPAVPHTLRTMQHKLIPAEGVKESWIRSVLWPTMDDEVKVTGCVPVFKLDQMVETEVLGDQSGKPSLTKRNKLVGGHSGRRCPAKTGIVGGEVLRQQAPQARPIPQVEGAAKLVDGVNDCLAVD